MDDQEYTNLVVCSIPLDSTGKQVKELHINTALLTKIRATKGRRWNKHDTKRRRLRKVWNERHPALSKFYAPMSLWENDFGWYDRWMPAKVIIQYVDHDVITVPLKSDQLAMQARDLLNEHFWGSK